jgi:hypothetical protein
MAVSRLSDQTKVLAQRLALLEKRTGDVEDRVGEEEGADQPVLHAGDRD